MVAAVAVAVFHLPQQALVMPLVLVGTRRNFAGGGRNDGGEDLDNGGYGGGKPLTCRRDGKPSV